MLRSSCYLVAAADSETQESAVIAGFVDGPAVSVAAEAAKVSLLERETAAVAEISVATGTEIVVLTCPAVLTVELVAVPVPSVQRFVARTEEKIAAIVFVADASVRDQIVVLLVTGTWILVVRMSIGMNSYQQREYFGRTGYCLSVIVAAEAESKQQVAAHFDLGQQQVNHYLQSERIFVVVVVEVVVVVVVVVAGAAVHAVAVVVVVAMVVNVTVTEVGEGMVVVVVMVVQVGAGVAAVAEEVADVAAVAAVEVEHVVVAVGLQKSATTAAVAVAVAAAAAGAMQQGAGPTD